MEFFEAHVSKPKTALLALAALGFVIAGLWIIGAFGQAPQSRRFGPGITLAFGWAAILFFGLCLGAWLRRLFNTAPLLRISPAGIQAAHWSDDTIPWSEITEVSTWSHRNQVTILLHLRDPARFPGRGLAAALAGLNRRMTGGDIAISLTGTNRSAQEALAAITRYLPSAG